LDSTARNRELTPQLDLHALLEGDADRALVAIPEWGHLRLLYRGWMLTGEEYEALDEALGERGHALMTTPAEYAAAHYLPNWYPRLKGYTARSVWTEGTDPSEAWEAAQELGSLDVAMLEDGRWVVVEVNDGGVSGLPASIDPRELFAALLGVER